MSEAGTENAHMEDDGSDGEPDLDAEVEYLGLTYFIYMSLELFGLWN